MAGPTRPPRSAPHPYKNNRGRGALRAQSTARPITVIASLNDVSCYEADDGTARVSRDGEILPTKSRRKTFGPGLHRLRDRLRHLDERLQLDINGLKQEVINLQLNKSLMENKMQLQWMRRADAAVQRVTEYFGAFKHGWTETRSKLHLANELVSRQRHFVAAAIHPAMQFGDFADGLQVMVNQWEVYSTSYGQLQLSLDRVNCDFETGLPVVRAVGAIHAVLTERSLAVIFPRLPWDSEAFQRLLGARVVFQCRWTGYFDESMRIVRIDPDVDHAAGLLSLVPNVADVAYALDGALLPDNPAWSHVSGQVVQV